MCRSGTFSSHSSEFCFVCLCSVFPDTGVAFKVGRLGLFCVLAAQCACSLACSLARSRRQVYDDAAVEALLGAGSLAVLLQRGWVNFLTKDEGGLGSAVVMPPDWSDVLEGGALPLANDVNPVRARTCLPVLRHALDG